MFIDSKSTSTIRTSIGTGQACSIKLLRTNTRIHQRKGFSLLHSHCFNLTKKLQGNCRKSITFFKNSKKKSQEPQISNFIQQDIYAKQCINNIIRNDFINAVKC